MQQQTQVTWHISLVRPSGLIVREDREWVRSVSFDLFDQYCIGMRRYDEQCGDPNLLETGMLHVDPEYAREEREH